MTDPTHDDRPDPSIWRLLLDEGDGLEVRLAARSKESTSEPPDIPLWLSAGRAYDLSRVLRAYNPMVAIFTEASQVSGTGESRGEACERVTAGRKFVSADPPIGLPRSDLGLAPRPVGGTAAANERALSRRRDRPEWRLRTAPCRSLR